MNCVFCKIVSGDLPCAKVFETDDILAFLDHSPVEHGHTLVIPKMHIEQVMELPDRLLAPLAFGARAVARRLREKLEADGITLSQANAPCAGQVVPHVHVHVIPRYKGKPVHFRGGRYTLPVSMQAMAEKLAFALEP